MKQIVPELSRAAAQELVDEQRKEYRLVGSVKRVPGLILFEYDLTTGELSRADMKKELELTIDGRLNKNHNVSSKSLCLYIQAINEQNAMRKVQQLLKRKSVRNQLLKPQNNGQ
jgi:hypothetical protein